MSENIAESGNVGNTVVDMQGNQQIDYCIVEIGHGAQCRLFTHIKAGAMKQKKTSLVQHTG